ncbi:MAG: cell division protein FtsQ/DivIB [candidate division KSB1 bacterium]|nr:cell division protein FtsQ/DivIB [candidate division KSB1 bacterium]
MKTCQKSHNGLRPHLALMVTLIIAAVVINHMMIQAPAVKRTADINIRTAGTGQIRQNEQMPAAIQKSVLDNRKKTHDRETVLSRAVALFRTDRFYLIDKNGSILAPVDSVGFVDMPILSGQSLEIDSMSGVLTGPFISDALNFTRLLKTYPDLYAQCSEIIIDDEKGVVAFMDWDDVLPIILGSRDMERKLHKLDVLSRHVHTVPEIRKARYVALAYRRARCCKKEYIKESEANYGTTGYYRWCRYWHHKNRLYHCRSE